MRVVILSIGSELLRGDIVDTNAAFLAREVSQMGAIVPRVEQIGDDREQLADVLREALQTADVVLCTGGLGPTDDDVTRDAIACVAGEEIVTDDGALRQLKSRFAGLARPMPEHNIRQAGKIESSEFLDNPRGSAPGWYVKLGEQVIAAMPGPPSEMKPMWHEYVFPLISGLQSQKVAMDAVMTFGIGESTVESMLEQVLRWHPDVTVATYAKREGVQVHVTARSETQEDAQQLLETGMELVRSALGTAIFGGANDTLSMAAGRMLDERGLTLSVMESCTGGELSSMLTNNAGSSKHFLGGIIAYSEDVKKLHGVPAEIVETHGLISAQTAIAMARAARESMAADIGLGTTGIAGSESLEGKPPGTCFVALSRDDEESVREIHRPASRQVAKTYFAHSALDLLRQHLLERVVSPV